MIGDMGRSQREVYGETLVELARGDERILVLDGDLASSTRADIFANAFPDRFLQMGIAEQNMFGVAAGLSTMGFVPFVGTFACFAVCRALDQIRVLVTQPGLNVKIIGAYSGILTGLTGKTHHVVNDLAVMRSMPGLAVVAPGDDVEAAAVLRWAADFDGPVYVRLARDASPRLFADDYSFQLGVGIELRQGADVGIVSTGTQTARALEAAHLLASEGIEAAVLHLPTLKPLDERAITKLARSTGRLVTTEDHTTTGGLGGAVAEVLADQSPALLRCNGIADTYGESAPNDALLDRYGISGRRVAAFVRTALHAWSDQPDTAGSAT